MTRRFHGRFAVEDNRPHPDLAFPARPLIAARIQVRARRGVVPFLIDTGADYTFLSSHDAEELMGVEYQRLEFDGAQTVLTWGTAGATRNLIEPAAIGLLDDDGRELVFSLPILIAEPVAAPVRHDEYWQMPSLVGRDILELLALHVDRPNGEVYLELSED